MKAPKEVLKIFENYTPIVDAEIKELLTAQKNLDMYKMMGYFFGYTDENFKEVSEYGGKHFRSGLCLLISDFYGTSKRALAAATSIEIFHNFTLIHDDIEDCDPIRRGRPSVWKVWGVNHGINTGDAQLILANQEIIKGLLKTEAYKNVIKYLNQRFLEVAEGQFLDFNLADSSIAAKNVTQENYLEMITKKSGVLVGASACVAGMIAEKSEEECKSLWDYGLNLGLAYQLNDDLASIWGNIEDTGKVEEKDIEERKKTLPIIYAFSKLSEEDKVKFTEIYDQPGNLTHDEISEVKNLLSENDAHEFVWKKIQDHLEKSVNAIEGLGISQKQKDLLNKINVALVPNIKVWSNK